MFTASPSSSNFSLTFANGYTVHVAFTDHGFVLASDILRRTVSLTHADVRIEPVSALPSHVTPDELAQLLEHVRGLPKIEEIEVKVDDAIPANDSTVTKLQQSGCEIQ